MSKTELVRVVANGVISNAKKHSPELLTGIGLAGMATSVIFAVKATPKVKTLIEKKKEEECVDKLPPIDILKIAWKPYAPVAVTFAASAACIIGANSVNASRNAALATVCTMSESAFHDYKNKVVDTIGEEKERDIRKAITKDKIEENAPVEENVTVTGNGDVLCYEPLSGRWFYSSANHIQKAVNLINERMLKYQYTSLNDFYYELGLQQTKLGNELGWNIYQGNGMIEVDTFGEKDIHDRPCLVLDFDRLPTYDFDMMC